MITPDCVSDISAGSVFYGVSVNYEYPEFVKLEAVKSTGKQVVAYDLKAYQKYKRTLRISSWSLFYDYEEARDFWVKHHIVKKITEHHKQIERLMGIRESLMEKTDL